jgi:hypothetical protein
MVLGIGTFERVWDDGSTNGNADKRMCGALCLMYRICIKIVKDRSLDGPYFGTSISTTRNKVFIDEPHFLRRFRVTINDHTRMCMCRSIVILNPIFTGTSNDFT